MKLIHCADVHLDSRLSSRLSEEKAKERRNELLHNFIRLCDYADCCNANGVLIAGDLFDRNTVSKRTENAVLDAISSHPDVTFFYVPGNHDSKCFLTRMETCPGNLVLFGDKPDTLTINGKGNITLTSLKITEANYKSFYEDIRLDRNKFNIVMLHGEERGKGSPNPEENLNFGLLKNRYVDYLALGHIHAGSQFKLDGRCTAIYPGCLEGKGFDECGEHGFYIADIDEDTLTAVYSFVPYARRRMFLVPVDCTGAQTTEDMAAAIENTLADVDFKSTDYLKLVLTGSVDALCEKNTDYLYKLFSYRAEVVEIQDQTSFCVNYEEYAKDPTLKGEFVRIVRKANLSEEDKAQIIRLGINALMGEEPD